jgi:cohesin loading factor subunit SCC2
MIIIPRSKCSKWVPGKKSALGDKPAIKRREVPLVWERMVHATRPVRTEEDAVVQQTKVLSFLGL